LSGILPLEHIIILTLEELIISIIYNIVINKDYLNPYSHKSKSRGKYPYSHKSKSRGEYPYTLDIIIL